MLNSRQLQLKTITFYAKNYSGGFFEYSRKSDTFASGKCGEICLLATTLKNAKKFHIVFLVYLHVFHIRWSFLLYPRPKEGGKENLNITHYELFIYKRISFRGAS